MLARRIARYKLIHVILFICWLFVLFNAICGTEWALSAWPIHCRRRREAESESGEGID
jgi:hypothetical protein